MTADKGTPENGGRGQVKRVETRFAKSNFYRVIHADGAWGGLTPHGAIRMALFSESVPCPESVTYEAGDGGLREISRASPPSGTLIRELEVDVVLSVSVARSLRDWLDDKIKKFEEAQRSSRERRSGEVV